MLTHCLAELPDSNIFVETYLREIGVQTPVSLLSLHDPAAAAVATVAATDQHPESMPTVVPQVPAGEIVAVKQPAAVDRQQEPVVFKTLQEIGSAAAGCRLCGLAESRTHVVFGSGNPHADIVFVGEAPGQDEDLQGEPFVGQSGQLLERMLAAIGLSRDAVYIMNTIKCRPPNNRDPRKDEVEACSLWFEQQIDALQPKMICLLGRVAAQTVLNSDANLADMRGQWHAYQGIPVWVTYHPAFLLRSPEQKQKCWQDLCELAACYRKQCSDS